MKSETCVTLSLTSDQALVFFEWLSRQEEVNALSTDHPAEQKVLWEIEAQLERVLVEPLQAEYGALLAAARERLVSDGES